jgi:hypothetical protein
MAGAAGAVVAIPGRGVKRIFTKGEIIPIDTPLRTAKPTMRSAVITRRARYG